MPRAIRGRVWVADFGDRFRGPVQLPIPGGKSEGQILGPNPGTKSGGQIRGLNPGAEVFVDDADAADAFIVKDEGDAVDADESDAEEDGGDDLRTLVMTTLVSMMLKVKPMTWMTTKTALMEVMKVLLMRKRMRTTTTRC
mmetsp:Transcript_11537/g.29183  ORF Transcript_11537/g.29183 Transcript_11537/m.29183 type:complete len:140 (-) Transcript_11537:299-718(-)